MNDKKKISEENLKGFLDGITKVLIEFLEKERVSTDSKTIRMSSIGRPNRRIWLDIHEPVENNFFSGATLIKFLYGSIIEELIILLAKEAGHKVDSLQKEVTLEGVVGHMDCKIDNEVVDIKSASNFSFRKFKTGNIENDDPFGYVEQVSGYVQAEGKEKGFLLGVNKVTGELALVELDELALINASERIQEIKKVINSSEKPILCYHPEPDGKSGNMKLNRNCVYCPHKWSCYPHMRIFKYKEGDRYLTAVQRLPNVPDVTEEKRGL
tara:strand:- start:326 stop:1129 length:804 start_codon:yes stop_codon:yes gene_type:complete